ncbi:F-box protein PP2-A13 [Ananas comosus]|uniref:F-box protein PP2-A13 n=1 Tax=Ananas comosus TaxID=4615 RepID=A0A199VRK3_ANACO|nr:F-box protein PP2-A13 [Ananas comosus]
MHFTPTRLKLISTLSRAVGKPPQPYTRDLTTTGLRLEFTSTCTNRFHTVAYLHQIWWLEVRGEIDFGFPEGTYSLFFRLHLGRAYKRLGRRVCSPEHIHGWDIKPVWFHLSTSDGQQAQSKCYLEEPGMWVYYHVGDFAVRDSFAPINVKFSMTQIDCTHTKGGLCIDSVLIQPRGIKQQKIPPAYLQCQQTNGNSETTYRVLSSLIHILGQFESRANTASRDSGLCGGRFETVAPGRSCTDSAVAYVARSIPRLRGAFCRPGIHRSVIVVNRGGGRLLHFWPCVVVTVELSVCEVAIDDMCAHSWMMVNAHEFTKGARVGGKAVRSPQLLCCLVTTCSCQKIVEIRFLPFQLHAHLWPMPLVIQVLHDPASADPTVNRAFYRADRLHDVRQQLLPHLLLGNRRALHLRKHLRLLQLPLS